MPFQHPRVTGRGLKKPVVLITDLKTGILNPGFLFMISFDYFKRNTVLRKKEFAVADDKIPEVGPAFHVHSGRVVV